MSEATPLRGHVFIVQANALRIDCDALAVSTDSSGKHASPLWQKQDPYLGNRLGSPTPIEASRDVYPVERLSDEGKGFTPYHLPTQEQSRNTAFKTGVTALLKQFGR